MLTDVTTCEIDDDETFGQFSHSDLHVCADARCRSFGSSLSIPYRSGGTRTSECSPSRISRVSFPPAPRKQALIDPVAATSSRRTFRESLGSLLLSKWEWFVRTIRNRDEKLTWFSTGRSEYWCAFASVYSVRWCQGIGFRTRRYALCSVLERNV